MGDMRWAVVLLAGGILSAQTGPPAPASEARQPTVLDRIKARMADNLARLPDYTCVRTTERAHRRRGQKSFQRQDLVRLEVAMVAGRELFGWPGGKRIDEAELSSFVDKGLSGSGEFGGFVNAIFLTGTPQFEYRGETSLAGRRTVLFAYRLQVRGSAYRIQINDQSALVGFHGLFWVDAGTLDLLRLEVQADDIPPQLNLDFAHDSVDYARVKIGSGDFLLPRASEVVMQDLDGNENRNRTSFGACRQYTGEAVLSFAEAPPETAAKASASVVPDRPEERAGLPAEFAADGLLEAPVRADSTAVGDPIAVRLEQAIRNKGKVAVPKGALLVGRVTRAEHVNGAFFLRLSFDAWQSDNATVNLGGRQVRAGIPFVSALPPTTPTRIAIQGEQVSVYMADDTMVFATDRLTLPRGFRMSLRSRPGEKVRAPHAETVPAELPQSTTPRPPPVEPPVFKTERATVVVDAIVTDRKGRRVPGLSAGDFTVYEDNTSQEIASFAAPAVRGGSDSQASSSATQRPPAGTPAPMTLLIDLGDLHQHSLKRACDAAAKFADKTISAGSGLAIYWVDSTLHLAMPFSKDRQRARDVLKKLSGRVPSGPFTVEERERTQNEIDESGHGSLAGATSPSPGGHATPDTAGMGGDMLRSWLTVANSLQARAVFVALRAMALAYRPLSGRKNVVVFSEGFLHALNGGPEIEAVIDAANRANVAIYVIDASGMSVDPSNANFTMSIEKQTYDPRDAFGPPILGEGPPDSVAGGLDIFDRLQTLGSDRRADLGWIAHATGGFLVTNTNDLGAALDQIERDTSDYYTLTYSPSNRNFDGAFRKIRVELASRGYRVRYRRGYWALPPGREIMMTPAAAQLLAAIESGGRKSSFAPQLNAVLVPAMDGSFRVSAAVSMPGKLVKFEKLQDQHVSSFSVVLIARDEQGRIVGVHERYGDLRLARPEYDAFCAGTFNLQGNVPVTGIQTLSVEAIVRFADETIGVSSPRQAGSAAGSSDLRLTSLVLSDGNENSKAGPCSPAASDPLCVDGARMLLPSVPQFDRFTTLVVYCGLLGLGLDTAEKPDLSVRFRWGAGGSLIPVKPKQFAVTRGSAPNEYVLVAAFDLSALQPGRYELEMAAHDKIRGAHASERTELVVE